MELCDLPLEDRFVEHFEGEGIEELYPPQAAAVDAGVVDGESVVAAVPTASGKTLIAQLAMLAADGPALYVVPLRALADEKRETFERLPGISVGIATGDYDATDEELADHDVVVATSEKVDAAIRTGARWVERIETAVVDEVHLLDDLARGPTLEVTIAKLRRLSPDLQIVALSATVPNADGIADWLDATVVHSDWRPVDLRTGVYDGEAIDFDDGDQRTVESGADDPEERTPTAALVADALRDGGQCLVFVNSRRAARGLAGDLVEDLDESLLAGDRTVANGGSVGTAEVDAEATELLGSDSDVSEATTTGGDALDRNAADRIRETATTPTGDVLASVAESGVAFHHAGLRSDHRSLVERAFRDRELRVVCATPTLAAGVNVPARRVIVRDHRRYGDGGYEPLSTLEVRQMFGRAGRPSLDPYGEAIVVADDGDEDDVRGRYLEGNPDGITSKLDDTKSLRPHVLATVASGFADSRAELRDVLGTTFCAHQGGADDLQATADDVIDGLVEAGMLHEDDGLAATELGALVARVYVDPGTGADVVAALDRAEGLDRVTTLTVCEIVCDTAEMPARYVRSDEAGTLSEFALRNDDVLAKDVHSLDGDFHAWLSTLKTARLLADYAEGVPLADLVEHYGVGPGDVRRYADRAEWLLTATESLAEHVDSDVIERVRDTRRRLTERER